MKKLYFITDHKTGTFWTGDILELFCKNTNFLFIPLSHKGFKGIVDVYKRFKKLNKLNKRKFIYNYFTKDKIYFLNRADIKKRIKKHPSVIIIRDPRDICISAANYDGKDSNDDPKDKDFYNYKKYVEGMSFEEKVLMQCHNQSLNTVKRLSKFIDNNNPLIIKYEDLFLDIDNDFIILKKISEHLNFNSIEKNKFINFYLMTHITNTNRKSHVNSGQPKQFKSLSLEVLDVLNDVMKDYILKFNYSID